MNKIFLLDTNILLWWLTGDKRLKTPVVNQLSSPDNLVYCSVASLWEILIKASLGKLKLKVPFKQIVDKTPFPFLSIKKEHILLLERLPYYHKDPFDRILIAQTIGSQATLITANKMLAKYKIPIQIID